MTRCLRPRTGAAWPATLPVIPYMRANLRRKQSEPLRRPARHRGGQRSCRVGALRERAPELERSRIEAIPNGVDVTGCARGADATPRPMPERYALFVGKLAKNKGAHALVDVAAARRVSRCRWSSLATDPSAESVEQAAASAGRDVRILGWRDRREVFQWLRHAELLIFPSVWPEPLSRVLIEASALSVPIAAINTGGTADIIVDEETGLLSDSCRRARRRCCAGSRLTPAFARGSEPRPRSARQRTSTSPS